MNLPKFYFAESPDLPGSAFILATQRPCYIFRVFKFAKLEDFESFTNSHLGFHQIPGYMIAIEYFATIGEDAADRKDPEDIRLCALQAVDFYKEHRILVNERYYRRNAL